MTPDQRSDITNGIWLCRNHSVIVDDDEVTYTADKLREMKRKHEQSRRFAPHIEGKARSDDIISVGGNIVAVGEFIGVDSSGWKARIKHFVIGAALDLISFASDFAELSADNRYVIMTELGDGRILSSAPSVTTNGSAYDVTFPIEPNHPRISAQLLRSMAAHSETNDLVVKNGSWTMVSGLTALPQLIRMSLGFARGEGLFAQRWGTRIAEYYRDFAGSAWLQQLIKMEVIRAAAIPLADQLSRTTKTPLQCVNRVVEVEVLADGLINQRPRTRIVLDVEGVGRWEHEIPVFVHTNEQLQQITEGLNSQWAQSLRHQGF